MPTFDPMGSGTPPVVSAARLGEELGYDALWVGDHLICPAPSLDSLCALSALAAVTDRVELGISVLQLGLRHLVWTAKQLATVETLAPGRLRLGVGVGGEFDEEFQASGVDRHTRGHRLDEMLDVLPALLLGERVEHEGPQLVINVPEGLQPAVDRLPPLTVGGRSDAALTRAARVGDQWVGMWQSPSTVARCAERLGELAAAAGRKRPSVAMLVLVNVNDDAAVARQEVTRALWGQYRLDFDVVERWTPYGSVEEVAKFLAAYREAGVAELMLLPAAQDPLAQYERLAEVRQLVDS